MSAGSVPCPGCGLVLPETGGGPAERFYASAACYARDLELTARTLQFADPGFVHQLAVDAYAAQHVGPAVTPITVTFALVGLYLVNERGFTGRQVQRTHVALARQDGGWPAVRAPTERAALTVADVLASRDDALAEAIRQWSSAVWQLWRHEAVTIATLLRTRLDIR